MKLIVMRHGEAGRHPVDALRPLTARGRADTERVARDLRAGDWQPEIVWCSTLVRAQQTAGILASYFSLDVQEQPFLKPEDPLAPVISALQSYAGEAPLLLVSHMPLVGALAGQLTEDRFSHIPFSTSQAVCLEMDVAAVGCADFLRQYCGESSR